MIKINDINNVARVIRENNSFAIYSHINADFDAIASSLAFKTLLEKLGKVAHIFIQSRFPSNVDTLVGWQVINSQKQKAYDVAAILDCNDDKRIGKYVYTYRKNVKTIINIDHHHGMGNFAKSYYYEDNGSSTCELIYNLYKFLNVEIDKNTAKVLISGIYTDTGSLQFSCTHISTFRAVADLLNIYGDTMDKITAPIFYGVSEKNFKLRRLCYNRLELYENNAIAIVGLIAKDFYDIDAGFEETEGLVDVAFQLNDVKLMALISEDPDEEGKFKISLRSKGNYSVVNVASVFGGGGHVQASGCKIAGTFDEVKKKVLTELIKEYKRL